MRLAGDYNGDNSVDAADYAVWRNSENQSVEPGTGADGDRDGYISYNDYSVWRQFFGQKIITSTGTAAASRVSLASDRFAVPEPAGTVLLMAAAVFMMSTVRRRPD